MGSGITGFVDLGFLCYDSYSTFQIRILYLNTISDLFSLICLAWRMQSLVLYQYRIDKNLWCFFAGAEETSPAACSEAVWLGASMSSVACAHDSTEILYGTMDLICIIWRQLFIVLVQWLNEGNLCHRDWRRQIFQCWPNTCNRLHFVTNEWKKQPKN